MLNYAASITSVKAPFIIGAQSMGASLIARLKELEVENACLKKIYAEERLKSNIRQDAMTKKWERSLDAKHWLITISKSKIRRAVQLYYATTDI